MMKMKAVILLCLLMGTSSLAIAQDQKKADWKKMHTERIKEHAEKKADAMELKGDIKTEFTTLFIQYQNELMACHSKTGQRFHKNKNHKTERTQPKTTLTDAEANARVDRYFQAKEAQIESMKLNLEVQKKYRTKFARILNPQQMVKVFRDPMRMNILHHNHGQKTTRGKNVRGTGLAAK